MRKVGTWAQGLAAHQMQISRTVQRHVHRRVLHSHAAVRLIRHSSRAFGGPHVFQTSSQRNFSRGALWPLEKILNLQKYPIHDDNNIRRQQLIDKCRAGLRDDGYCYLPHFIHKDALEVLFETCIAHEGICNLSESVRTIWNQPISNFDPKRMGEQDDPTSLRKKYSKCTRGMVAMDEISPTGPLRSLYASDEFKDFLSLLRGDEAPPLCRLEDDLASCSVAIYSPGDSESWAFNRHALTANVVVQEANIAGRVQVLKNVWGPLQQRDNLVAGTIQTLLCANEVEHVGLSVGQHWTLVEILKSMDETEQPTFFLKGPLAVKNIMARAGGLLVTVGKQSLFRVAPVHGDEALILGACKYENAPGYRYHDDALVELFGRKRVGETRQESAPLEGGEHRVYGYDDDGKLVEVESPADWDISEMAKMAGVGGGSQAEGAQYKEAKEQLENDLGIKIKEGQELTEEDVKASLEKENR